jgi:hypothetical protein
MKKSELKEIIKAEFLSEKEDSKKGNKEEQKRMEGAIRDDRDHIKDLEKDIKDNERKLAKLKKDEPKDVNEKLIREFDAGVVAVGAPLVMSVVAAGVAKMGYDAVMDMIKKKFPKEDAEYSRDEDMEMAEAMRGGSYMEEDDLDEAMRGDMDEDDTMREQEDVDVEDDVNVDVKDEEDVDVDVKKDVEIDDESAESDIEVKSEVPGESADVSAILGLLTKAQERAEKMGDEKLMDQIGNTITYYTRAHVVAEAKDEDDVKEEMKDKKEDVKEELNEEVRRFKKLAGLIK